MTSIPLYRHEIGAMICAWPIHNINGFIMKLYCQWFFLDILRWYIFINQIDILIIEPAWQYNFKWHAIFVK